MIRIMTLRRIIYDDGSVQEHCFASVITGLTNIKESGERIAAENRLTINELQISFPADFVSEDSVIVDDRKLRSPRLHIEYKTFP